MLCLSRSPGEAIVVSYSPRHLDTNNHPENLIIIPSIHPDVLAILKKSNVWDKLSEVHDWLRLSFQGPQAFHIARWEILSPEARQHIVTKNNYTVYSKDPSPNQG